MSRPPFDQLRPLLGRRIDDLETAWLTARPDERAEIEVALELLRRRVSRSGTTLLEPPRGAEADGPLRMGRVVHGVHELGWLGLSHRELTQHLGVFGRSGSGKSVLCMNLLVQLVEQNVPWLVFDYKRSSRALSALDTTNDVHVLALGRHIDAAFAFNLLAPAPGVPRDTHQRQLCELIAESWYAGDGVISILERAMAECYEAFQPDLPTIADVRDRVEHAKSTGREAMWRQSAMRILNQLTTGQLGRLFCRRRDTAALTTLLDKHTILELDGLAVNDATFLTQHLMRHLTQTLLTHQQRERLQFVCLIEEAHHLLAKKPGGSESILETCLREGREIGLGIMLVDQTPASISPVAMANCYSVVVLNCRQRSDIQAAAGTLLLSDGQHELLSTLPVGEAVARLSDRWPRPIHIRVPLLELPKGQVGDEDVRLSFLAGPYALTATPAGSTSSAHSAPNSRSLALRASDRALPLADMSRQTTDSLGKPVADVRGDRFPPNHPHKTSDRLLSDDPELRLMLEHIAKKPLVAVTARFDELALSRRKGTALKNALISEGLIEQVDIITAAGRTVLLAPTDEGRRWFQSHRIAVTPTNGSLPHAWWQREAAELLRLQGWAAQIEYDEGGHTFDLLALRDDTKLLAEVETGRSDWLANIAALERADTDHRLVVWLDDASLIRARNAAPRSVTVLRPRELKRWVSDRAR
jgi:hypothetical protein